MIKFREIGSQGDVREDLKEREKIIGGGHGPQDGEKDMQKAIDPRTGHGEAKLAKLWKKRIGTETRQEGL